MKILIKIGQVEYNVLNDGRAYFHGGVYDPFLFRTVFRRLGHECEFIWKEGLPGQVITSHEGWDALLYWGHEAYVWDMEYAEKLLKEFKGIKMLQTTTEWVNPMYQYLTHIFPTDVWKYGPFYEEKLPHVKVKVVTYPGALPEDMDKDDSNPYPQDGKKICLHMGVVRPWYIPQFNYLAENGVNLYIAGLYHDIHANVSKSLQDPFVKNKLHPSIVILGNPYPQIPYAEHWKYCKYADCGLALTAEKGKIQIACCSKITEYMLMGLPCVAERGINNHHIHELNAGIETPLNDNKALLESVNTVMNGNIDRAKLMADARNRFDTMKIAKEMLDFAGVK